MKNMYSNNGEPSIDVMHLPHFLHAVHTSVRLSRKTSRDMAKCTTENHATSLKYD